MSVRTSNSNSSSLPHGPRLQCTYCRRLGHTKLKCYKKHEFLPNSQSPWSSTHNHLTTHTRVATKRLWTPSTLQTPNRLLSPSLLKCSQFLLAKSTRQCRVISNLIDINSSYWIFYSGAARHICYERSLFSRLYTVNNVSVQLLNQSKISVTLSGSVTLLPQLEFHDVLYIPTF